MYEGQLDGAEKPTGRCLARGSSKCSSLYSDRCDPNFGSHAGLPAFPRRGRPTALDCRGAGLGRAGTPARRRMPTSPRRLNRELWCRACGEPLCRIGRARLGAGNRASKPRRGAGYRQAIHAGVIAPAWIPRRSYPPVACLAQPVAHTLPDHVRVGLVQLDQRGVPAVPQRQLRQTRQSSLVERA